MIRRIHTESRETYGAPRIHAELRAQGVRVSRNRVARLMRQAGLAGVSRRRKRRTTKRDPGAEPAPDLVNRDFTASRPDELWVADITYITYRGRVSVSGGGGCVQPEGGGLGDEGPAQGGAGTGGAGDGHTGEASS